MGKWKPHRERGICVYIPPDGRGVSELNELLWGMEEEGVPYNLRIYSEKEAVVQSYNAALASPLEVGVGFGEKGYAALHSSKLNKDQPIFHVKVDKKNMRALGANAARLVKGIPFKPL